MMKTLKYPATCADCGADLPAGTVARLYRKRGRRGWVAYGRDCHQRDDHHEAAQEERTLAGPDLGMVEAATGEDPVVSAQAPMIGVAWTDSVREHAGPPLGHRVRCLTCHLCLYHDGSDAERALALAIARDHYARRHARPGAHMAEQLAATLAALA